MPDHFHRAGIAGDKVNLVTRVGMSECHRRLGSSIWVEPEDTQHVPYPLPDGLTVHGFINEGGFVIGRSRRSVLPSQNSAVGRWFQIGHATLIVVALISIKTLRLRLIAFTAAVVVLYLALLVFTGLALTDWLIPFSAVVVIVAGFILAAMLDRRVTQAERDFLFAFLEDVLEASEPMPDAHPFA
jgi:hypothetical protein